MSSVKVDMDGRREGYSQRDGYGQRDRSSRKEFVYVNQAYSGSTSSVSRVAPSNTVIREQYWACSRWPTFQKILVISVGVLCGLVIGLAIWVALAHKENPPLSDIFQRAHVAPD